MFLRIAYAADKLLLRFELHFLMILAGLYYDGAWIVLQFYYADTMILL